MALTYDTSLRNAFCDVLQSVFGGGSCELLASDDTVLATISLPTTAFGSSTSGAVDKAGTWSGSIGTSGAVAKFRLTGGGATMTGTAGGQGSGADMEVTNNIDGTADTELTAGNPVEVTGFTFTQPGS